ncbi:MAG: glutamate--tRNA ligase [Burkholderiales bacterium]
MIRTRFAPSPTGYLHLGGARTALFSWAYARRHGGKFILRIEDTDVERSTQQSIDAILRAMKWLGLDSDEGPFFQMQRLDRYKEVAEQLLRDGKAYWCYASKEELEQMREGQRARGEKPRYDGRWRDGKLPKPDGVKPVLRFRNPDDGDVSWDDLVKGPIVINNRELDDLVIMRADGVPTYNFGVVVDDLDMDITHVIRGDDHVNNTPRQINIINALGAPMPQFAHVPMILGADGERLSKRHGAVSVMQYPEDGFLPEALLNYLARLGWSHGDEEVFSLQQFVEWFDLKHISKSPAKFNPEKLLWLNQHYIKEADNQLLADQLKPLLEKAGVRVMAAPSLTDVIALLKQRATTLNELADSTHYFYRMPQPSDDMIKEHLTPEVLPALRGIFDKLQAQPQPWQRESLQALIKATVSEHKIKMPQLAMPLRVMVAGQTQTPAIDAVLALLGPEALRRMVVHHKLVGYNGVAQL